MLWTVKFSTFLAPPGAIVKSSRLHLVRCWGAGKCGNNRGGASCRDGIADQAIAASRSVIEEVVGSRRAILIEHFVARRGP